MSFFLAGFPNYFSVTDEMKSMSVVSTPPRPRRSGLREVLSWRAKVGLFLAVCLLAAVPRSIASEGHASFVVHPQVRQVPEVTFVDEEGRPRGLADFKGKVVLLNVWATWCPPCRLEMPALDNLQAALGGPDFEVVTLSMDRGGVEPVRRFFSETGVKRLAIFVDRSGKALRNLGALGLPTTILLDRDGREMGRLVGPAVWDSPQMVGFLRDRAGLHSAGRQPAE